MHARLCPPALRSGSADMPKLLEGYTYGWPPEETFTYTVSGTQVGGG